MAKIMKMDSSQADRFQRFEPDPAPEGS